MDRAGIEMQTRVIVVTTRAALRHTDGEPLQRTAIIARGRSLLESVAERAGDDGAEVISQAFTELESLAE